MEMTQMKQVDLHRKRAHKSFMIKRSKSIELAQFFSRQDETAIKGMIRI